MLATYSKFILGCVMILGLGTGCSSMKRFFAVGPGEEEVKPIENPFGSYGGQQKNENITYRSKNGDRSFEVEIPNNQTTDIEMPVNAKFSGEQRSAENIDYRYESQKATMADREIASEFSRSNSPQDEMARGEIEGSLGLQRTGELPNIDESYLAKMDVVKQLFTVGRYEASLLELDQLIKIYPTNARLFEMRGTVLDRMGYSDLAVRSWKQALEFEPTKVSLKKIIDKREQQRNVASERK